MNQQGAAHRDQGTTPSCRSSMFAFIAASNGAMQCTPMSRSAVLRGSVAAAGLAAVPPPAFAIPPIPEGKAEEPKVLYTPPSVKTVSTPESIKLAAHLKKVNAKLYGAYWCSHCYEQKATFGAAATKMLTYVECAADGYKSERTTCKDKEIQGYPTWEIKGKLYPGEQTLEELAEISDFKGWPSASDAAGR